MPNTACNKVSNETDNAEWEIATLLCDYTSPSLLKASLPSTLNIVCCQSHLPFFILCHWVEVVVYVFNMH